MGADARALVQYKQYDYWFDFAEFDVSRDYGFFGRVAGIRGDAMCDEYPKGNPEDYKSCDVLEHYGHAPTWLTLDEFSDVLQDIENENEDFLHWQWLIIESVMHMLKNEGYETRFIIGFDQG
jgi:hypothetical protein